MSDHSTAAAATPSSGEQAFYVGYLSLPADLGRFLRFAVPTMLWVLVMFAAAVSSSQSDPGNAVWSDGKVQAFRGTLVSWPYPMVLVPVEPSGAIECWLLVEMGKRGVSRDLASVEGRSVVISGWTLDRDGRRIIELEPGEDALSLDEAAGPAPLPVAVQAVGGVTISGEIVDSKCYLGAMKPGEGKTHKACATLCIRGGIPPMLVSRAPSGRREYTLLCEADGSPLAAEHWPMIADPVRVTGDLETLGNLRRLRVHRGGVVRR